MGRTIGLTVGIVLVALVLNTRVVHGHGSSATKPSVPVLSAPADGATTSDNTPTFSWEASTDSDGHTLTYTIEVSSSSDFSTGVTQTSDLTTTSHTPSSAIADGTWYWRVRAVDPHNAKSQFSSGRSLVVDTTAPSAPSVNAVTSPVNADNQTVTGTAEANALVTITGGAASASQQLSGGATSFSISVSLTQDATNTLSVTATDAAGNVSNAAGATIVEDSTAPAVPTASPTGGLFDASQAVTLSAESGATIRYTTDGSTPTGSSTQYTSALTISSTTTLKAIAIDTAGNASGVLTETYTIDTTAPGAPSVDTPSSPVNADTATITGIAEANALVRITGGAADASQQLSGGATAFSIAMSLTQDAVNTLSVTARDAAGNTSGATSVSVTEDSTAPSTPTASTRGGLFNATQTVTLSADSGATIRYTTDGSSPTGSSSVYSSSLTIAATTTLKATATDAAGNTSGVMTETYTIDATAPAAPAVDAPSSPVNANTAAITGTAEENAFVRMTGGAAEASQQLSGGATAFSIAVTLTQDATNALSVTARDAAGNTSNPASVTIVEDSTAPSAPSVNVVSSPVNADSQTVTGTAEANALVTITGGATTASQQLSGGATTFSIRVSLTQDATNTLSVTATDAAGNVSTVTTETITEDSTGPDVTLTPAQGLYEGRVSVLLSTEAGATAYFTLDRTTPTTASALYLGPIELTDTRVVTAIAVDALGNSGAPRRVEYGVARVGDGGSAESSGEGSDEPTAATTKVLAAAKRKGAVKANASIRRALSPTLTPRVAGASSAPRPADLLPFVNRLFRSAHGRIPTMTEWTFWARRVLAANKSSLPAVLGAMQWQREHGR